MRTDLDEDRRPAALIAEVTRRVQARQLGWVRHPSAPVCRIQTALHGIGLVRGEFRARRFPMDLDNAYGLIYGPHAHDLVVEHRGLLVRCGLTVHVLEVAGRDYTLVLTDPDPQIVVHATCASRAVRGLATT